MPAAIALARRLGLPALEPPILGSSRPLAGREHLRHALNEAYGVTEEEMASRSLARSSDALCGTGEYSTTRVDSASMRVGGCMCVMLGFEGVTCMHMGTSS